MISVVTLGEALSFARKLGWGAQKQAALETTLRSLVHLDISATSILETYARFDWYTERIGHRMGQQNDLWIAATAGATGARLLTTDRDFDVLHPSHLERTLIDPRTGAILDH